MTAALERPRRPTPQRSRLAAALIAAGRAIRSVRRLEVIVFGALGAVLAVALFLGPVALAAFRAEYGLDVAAGQSTWRALVPAYADVPACAACHDRQYARLTRATHAGIGCESCHGPLREHALASPGTVEAEVRVEHPTDEICLSCHAKVAGRPESVRVVEPWDHYVTTCLACHDPHTGISERPPVVSHQLGWLPDCVVCHGPDGFKARAQRHPDTSDEDDFCLSCHLPGRGPDDGEEDGDEAAGAP